MGLKAIHPDRAARLHLRGGTNPKIPSPSRGGPGWGWGSPPVKNIRQASVRRRVTTSAKGQVAAMRNLKVSEKIMVGFVIAAALGVTWLLKHDSMWLPWLFAYAIPVLCLAFVAWAVATRSLPNGVRRATMVAAVVVACGAWLLLRQDGINGDHNATFGWRWAASSEERLLAQTSNETATTAAPAAAPSVAPVTTEATASPSATPATEAPSNPTTPTANAQAEWPGFRGPRRDGIVRGVRIKTDWSTSPPAPAVSAGSA